MNNVDINSTDLDNALKVVRITVGNSKDIASHYLFRESNGGLEVLSYNGSTFSSAVVPHTVADPGVKFTIEAKRLHPFLTQVGSNQVLSLTGDGDSVSIRTVRNKPIPFYGLDTSLFPFWDSLLASAKVTVKIAADRLFAALTHTKQFIYAEESKAPQLCVAEFRGGVLYSTDNTAISLVKMPGMEGSSLRVLGKNLGDVLSFLSMAKGQEVEILETDRSNFIRRGDGAIFGEAVYAHRFPDFSMDWALEDDQSWAIFQEELTGSIKLLQCGAKEGDTRVRFEREGNELSVAMIDPTGKPIPQSIPLVESSQRAGADAKMPLFAVSDQHLFRMLNGNVNTKVTLGVTRRDQGGWMRVRDLRGPDTYLTTVAWLKNA